MLAGTGAGQVGGRGRAAGRRVGVVELVDVVQLEMARAADRQAAAVTVAGSDELGHPPAMVDRCGTGRSRSRSLGRRAAVSIGRLLDRPAAGRHRPASGSVRPGRAGWPGRCPGPAAWSSPWSGGSAARSTAGGTASVASGSRASPAGRRGTGRAADVGAERALGEPADRDVGAELVQRAGVAFGLRGSRGAVEVPVRRGGRWGGAAQVQLGHEVGLRVEDDAALARRRDGPSPATPPARARRPRGARSAGGDRVRGTTPSGRAGAARAPALGGCRRCGSRPRQSSGSKSSPSGESSGPSSAVSSLAWLVALSSRSTPSRTTRRLGAVDQTVGQCLPDLGVLAQAQGEVDLAVGGHGGDAEDQRHLEADPAVQQPLVVVRVGGGPRCSAGCRGRPARRWWRRCPRGRCRGRRGWRLARMLAVQASSRAVALTTSRRSASDSRWRSVRGRRSGARARARWRSPGLERLL